MGSARGIGRLVPVPVRWESEPLGLLHVLELPPLERFPRVPREPLGSQKLGLLVLLHREPQGSPVMLLLVGRPLLLLRREPLGSQKRLLQGVLLCWAIALSARGPPGPQTEELLHVQEVPAAGLKDARQLRNRKVRRIHPECRRGRPLLPIPVRRPVPLERHPSGRDDQRCCTDGQRVPEH